jgi:DNA sulfur modification protein DndE
MYAAPSWRESRRVAESAEHAKDVDTKTPTDQERHELYLGLLKARCERDGLDAEDEKLNRQFRLHLHRGIGYLAAPNRIRGIADLVATAVQA